jgi:hypothetical protein
VVASGAAAAQAGAVAALRSSQQATDTVGEALGQTGALVASAIQGYSDRARPAMQTLENLANLPPIFKGCGS